MATTPPWALPLDRMPSRFAVSAGEEYGQGPFTRLLGYLAALGSRHTSEQASTLAPEAGRRREGGVGRKGQLS